MSEGRHVTRTVSYWVATRAFDFSGVKFREGQPVPCHRAPFAQLLNFGGMFVRPVNHDRPEKS